MKTIALTAIFSLTITTPLLAYDTNVLSNEQSRVSYAIGMSLGTQWKQRGIEVNNDLVLRGLNDARSGGPTLMNQQEIDNTLREYTLELAAKAARLRREIARTNEVASEAFLAANKKKNGVVTLPDGLQYKIITEGTGPAPQSNDTVTVSYEGTLLNGTKVDSSEKTALPVAGAGGIWGACREAIRRMKVGSEWQLFIPPNLAYGSIGRPPLIEPNSVLIYKIKLLSTEQSQSKSAQPITSDIIEVPSAAEMKKGAKIRVIKQPDDAQKAQPQSQPAK